MISMSVRDKKANSNPVRGDKKCNHSFIHSMNDFLIHLKACGCANSTILCYYRDLRWLMRFLGPKRLIAINDKDIERAIFWLCEYSPRSNKRSATTINRTKSAYRSFFRWAFESGRVSVNPTARLFLAKTSSRPTIPILKEEIDILLCTIRKSSAPHSGRDEALFATYAFTGIRRTEALCLRREDYDLFSHTLYLRQTKGEKKRILPVSERLAEILERHIRNLQYRNEHRGNMPIFFGRHHEMPLSPREAQVRFNKWKTASGIRKSLTIHSFRAGFCTLLYQRTRDLLLVSHAMGHADIKTTKRYVCNDIFAVRDAIEKTF